MDSINRFQIRPIQRKYFEQTKCLNLCVKGFNESIISEPERTCLKQCFAKMNAVEGFFLGKLKQTMEYLVISDPALKKTFQQAKKN